MNALDGFDQYDCKELGRDNILGTNKGPSRMRRVPIFVNHFFLVPTSAAME